MTMVTRRTALLGLSAATVAVALPASAATDHPVTMQGMKFNPAELTVKVGDTVTFTNMDAVPHTGSAKDGSFDTGKLSKGKSGTVQIAAAGDIAFFCKIHPSMKGIIHAA